MDVSRLAISQITTRDWGFAEDVSRYAALGIRAIGVWRDKVEAIGGMSMANKILQDHQMTVTNLCFAGLFTEMTSKEQQLAIDDAKLAIEQAKFLNAGCLLMVSGPVKKHSLVEAEQLVVKSFEEIVDYAEQLGVNLGLEALHPMDISQWSVIRTIGQALDIIEKVNSPRLGLFLDLYNCWWDPQLEQAISRSAGKIMGVHIADWRENTRSFTDRTIPGEGIISLEALIAKIESVGYRGHYDIEIFSDELWSVSDNYPSMLGKVISWFKGLGD